MIWNPVTPAGSLYIWIRVAKKLFLESYGCQMNEADSEVILGVLTKNGYELTDSVSSADVILFNTCAVREHAETRIYGRVSQLSPLKNKNPELVIGICGCMATHLKEKILDEAPLVDLVVGPDSYRRLPELIEKAVSEPFVDVRLDKYETYADLEPKRESGVRAWVSIMRGCDKFCTFCIVPYVRGRERCLTLPQILSQVQELADEDYKEIVFLGQTVNSYRDKENGFDFVDLLEKTSQIEGIVRIRFTSPHPIDFDDKTIEVMKNNSKICPQVHLPLQSASDSVLDKMKRRYNLSYYDELLRKFREAIPGIAITTDIIVGFPTETEEDFLKTFDYMQKVKYDSAFMFIYSPRPGAKAFNWGDPIPHAEKVKRLESLIKLQEKITLEIHRKEIGKKTLVLTEGQAKKEKGHLFGKNPQYKTVVFPQDGIKAGEFVTVSIKQATPHTLLGVVE